MRAKGERTTSKRRACGKRDAASQKLSAKGVGRTAGQLVASELTAGESVSRERSRPGLCAESPASLSAEKNSKTWRASITRASDLRPSTSLQPHDANGREPRRHARAAERPNARESRHSRDHPSGDIPPPRPSLRAGVDPDVQRAALEGRPGHKYVAQARRGSPGC